MTNRLLLSFIGVFVCLAAGYIGYFLHQPRPIQEQLRDITPVALAIPAAVIAFLFQLRLSRLSRLDAWVRDYQTLLREIAEWLARADIPYTNEECAKIARWYAQAEGLTALLRSLGVWQKSKDCGAISGLCETLYQQSGCPPATPRDHELVKIFEGEFYEHVRAAPAFISKLYQ